MFSCICVFTLFQSRANKWLTGWLIDYNYMLKIALHKFWWACQSLYLERAVWRHSGRLRGVIKQLHSTHPHLMALCPGLPGEPEPERQNQSGFYWSKRQWVAVASAGPYAICTLLQADNHASTPPLSFLLAGCPANGVKALKANNYKTASVPFYHSF